MNLKATATKILDTIGPHAFWFLIGVLAVGDLINWLTVGNFIGLLGFFLLTTIIAAHYAPRKNIFS